MDDPVLTLRSEWKHTEYVEPIAPKLAKLYVAVYQNVCLEKSNQMIPRTSPHLRYDEAKVRLHSKKAIYRVINLKWQILLSFFSKTPVKVDLKQILSERNITDVFCIKISYVHVKWFIFYKNLK